MLGTKLIFVQAWAEPEAQDNMLNACIKGPISSKKRGYY